MGEVITVASLKGKRVYLDTNLFIYAVEDTHISPEWLAVISTLLGMGEEGEVQLLTSELALAEVLVGAYKQHNELTVLYEELLTDGSELAVYPVDKTVLRTAAYARSQVKLSLADAIHVGTAIAEQADYFISNDDKLRVPEGIKKVALSELLA